MSVTFTQQLRSARRPGNGTCQHLPRCPHALAPDRISAHTVATHPEQGWSLLCNGVILFDDGGALLPSGQAITPTPTDAPTRTLLIAA